MAHALPLFASLTVANPSLHSHRHRRLLAYKGCQGIRLLEIFSYRHPNDISLSPFLPFSLQMRSSNMPQTSTQLSSPVSPTRTHLSPDVYSTRNSSPAPTDSLSGTRAFRPGSTTRQTSGTGTIAASTEAPTSLARRRDEFVLRLTEVGSPGVFGRKKIEAAWMVGSQGFQSHKPSLDPTLDLKGMCTLGNDIGRRFTEYTKAPFLRESRSRRPVLGGPVTKAEPSVSKKAASKRIRCEKALDLAWEDYENDSRWPPNATAALWTEMDHLAGPRPMPNISRFEKGAWVLQNELAGFDFTPLGECDIGSYPQAQAQAQVEYDSDGVSRRDFAPAPSTQ